MPTETRPLVVLAGPIHADGHALLAREADVVVAKDLSEAAVVELAREAQGLLLRGKPRCTPSLLVACRKLRRVLRSFPTRPTRSRPGSSRSTVAPTASRRSRFLPRPA